MSALGRAYLALVPRPSRSTLVGHFGGVGVRGRLCPRYRGTLSQWRHISLATSQFRSSVGRHFLSASLPRSPRSVSAPAPRHLRRWGITASGSGRRRLRAGTDAPQIAVLFELAQPARGIAVGEPLVVVHALIDVRSVVPQSRHDRAHQVVRRQLAWLLCSGMRALSALWWPALCAPSDGPVHEPAHRSEGLAGIGRASCLGKSVKSHSTGTRRRTHDAV